MVRHPEIIAGSHYTSNAEGRSGGNSVPGAQGHLTLRRRDMVGAVVIAPITGGRGSKN